VVVSLDWAWFLGRTLGLVLLSSLLLLLVRGELMLIVAFIM